ncbi:unnamed protein product [Cylicostephanus goldi]|uniref:Uncharacterized protein n=1 Tax=Cylicostephanus goldi TaxID=71465 RepID=A0A3P6REB5_CYLGO|nr:unnamed protein product [Cylicostephanus goldi]
MVAFVFTIQVCAAFLIGAAPAVPVLPAPVVAPAVAPAVAAPAIPAIPAVHTGLPVEVRNTMLTSDRETGHFSGTLHRSSDFGFPFAKKS